MQLLMRWRTGSKKVQTGASCAKKTLQAALIAFSSTQVVLHIVFGMPQPGAYAEGFRGVEAWLLVAVRPFANLQTEACQRSNAY